jgi:hypothetical protein
MELTNEEIDRAEAQILRELDERPGLRRPREVINAVRHEHGLSESVLRAAIWYLIDRNVIDLTTDLRVQRIVRPRPDRGALVS